MNEQFSQETINAFVIAAHHDYDKVRAVLAESPGLLNESAEWFETPIQAAAHTRQRAIAEFLLAQGAPLELTTAAMLNQIDDARAMLDEDADMIDDTGAHNIPLMYFAAISDSIPMAAFLLERGAAVNLGASGNTALHGAAGFGLAEMTRWLLEHDANPYATDMDGKLPIERAASDAVTAMLREWMASHSEADYLQIMADAEAAEAAIDARYAISDDDAEDTVIGEAIEPDEYP